MRYTRWNETLHCYTVPCLIKEDGEAIEFSIYSEPGDYVTDGKGNKILINPNIPHVYGEVIARLAELETRATPEPIMEQTHEFFIQGYLIKEIFYHCPNCGRNFGKHDPTRKIAHARYCESCGQALKWPKEKKDDKGTTENL